MEGWVGGGEREGGAIGRVLDKDELIQGLDVDK